MTDIVTYYKTYEAPPIDNRAIFRYMGVIAPTPELESLVDECLNLVVCGLVYKVAYREFDILREYDEIDLGFARTKSRSLSKALDGCSRIVLFAATIGIEPDRAIMRYKALSESRALAIQAIAAERIESLCERFCAELEDKYGRVKSRFSPGYGDLGLSLQKAVFAALDCAKIGLTLNESLIMSPTKSVSAIVGILDSI